MRPSDLPNDIMWPHEERAIEQKKRDKILRDQLFEDVRQTMSTVHGRRFLLHIIRSGFVFGSVYTGNAQTHYNAGKQDYARAILDLVAVSDPEAYLDVFRQHINELTGVGDHGQKAD